MDDLDYAMHVERWQKRPHWSYETKFLLDQFKSSAKPPVVLDFGCNTGAALDLMRALGWVGVGYDPNAAAIRYAREHYPKRLIFNSLSSLMTRPIFDGILMSEVLGHIEDPPQALWMASQLLLPGGQMVIGVPSVGYDIAMVPKNLLTGYRSDPTLLYMFTAKDIASILPDTMKVQCVLHTGEMPTWIPHQMAALLPEFLRLRLVVIAEKLPTAGTR